MQQYLSCISELEVRYLNASLIRTNYIIMDYPICAKYANYTIGPVNLLVADGTY